MTDYQSYPLWENGPDVVGNIDPNDLPISSLLRKKLKAWADKFESTLDSNDPRNSRFASDQAEDEFRTEGSKLANQLQIELGERYSIFYQT